MTEMSYTHSFAHPLHTTVTITASGETGTVIGVAAYTDSNDQYLIRYKAADGRAVEAWWAAKAISREPMPWCLQALEHEEWKFKACALCEEIVEDSVKLVGKMRDSALVLDQMHAPEAAVAFRQLADATLSILRDAQLISAPRHD